MGGEKRIFPTNGPIYQTELFFFSPNLFIRI
jgi:hypothetical protein